MREKAFRRRIPANRRTNDPATPTSWRISPAARRRFLGPSKDTSVLKRSKSEPSLPKGFETEKVAAEEEDVGVLCRPVTWGDLFPSPEISTPPKCYQKDAKVVVNVTVEGSPGPVKTLVKLGANVEETIQLVIKKYNEEGRIPPLDKHSSSTCRLHQSYFSLESLSKSDLIGDIGSRSFYLRKYGSEQPQEGMISNSPYQVDVNLNPSSNRSTISFTSIEKIILRFCNVFGCIPCING